MSEGPKLCPICRKPTQPRYRPFCSRRCADVDLARWFKGSYAIAADDQRSDGLPGTAADEEKMSGNS